MNINCPLGKICSQTIFSHENTRNDCKIIVDNRCCVSTQIQKNKEHLFNSVFNRYINVCDLHFRYKPTPPEKEQYRSDGHQIQTDKRVSALESAVFYYLYLYWKRKQILYSITYNLWDRYEVHCRPSRKPFPVERDNKRSTVQRVSIWVFY